MLISGSQLVYSELESYTQLLNVLLTIHRISVHLEYVMVTEMWYCG